MSVFERLAVGVFAIAASCYIRSEPAVGIMFALIAIAQAILAHGSGRSA